MKYIIMLLVAGLWGILSAHIFEPPTSYIVAFIGGGSIGYFWERIWDAFTEKSE